MPDYSDIFDYIETQEAMYKKPIPINDRWNWSMADHIKTTELYAHSQLLNGKDDFTPVKNITRPILNLQHRTEDIEMKDVQLYVNDPQNYHLSFLVKKYHDDVFVIENDLDTFFDELNVSRIDYGGGLSKTTAKGREVVPLQSLAFCDQTDLLSGPIGIKHFYSPDQLLDMEAVGWGDEKNGATITIPELIKLSREEKKDDRNGQVAQTPGRYIEVYEVHGNLPKKFADRGDTSGRYETRIFIVAFYQKKGDTRRDGVVLYTAPETKSPFKLIKRDPVHGRALGFGGAEELFEAQVWTNYSVKRKIDMLEAASKTILGATGANSTTIATRNHVRDMDNLTIVDLGEGDLKQIDTFPRNLRAFEDNVNEWEAHAQQMAAANDAIMGESPASGTPFKLQELVVSTNQGMHEYRRQQFAKHIEEIYTDDFIPRITKKITQGAKFLSELSLEELQYVADCLVRNSVAKENNERILNGELPLTPEEQAAFEDKFRTDFQKKGNKQFIEILKGEFKDKPLAVKVSVAGKSKNLSQLTDKVVNLWRFAFSNPQGFAQVMQIPGMAKGWNQIIEFSGLSPMDFSGIEKMAEQMQAQAQPTPAEVPELQAA